MISSLHKGQRDEFIALIDEYFSAGMAELAENATLVPEISAQLLDVLTDAEGQQAVEALTAQWAGWSQLAEAYQNYLAESADLAEIGAKNDAQHTLQAQFEPFFAALHGGIKTLYKIVRGYEKRARAENGRRGISRELKLLKEALDNLLERVKTAEAFFGHIHWLQERFPQAEYEDVTGLCKLATLDDVKEQDYSLNPGRYVGVVIEEDGRTEEEFIAELMDIQGKLQELNSDAQLISTVIDENIKMLVRDYE